MTSIHNVSHGIVSACLGGRCPYFFLLRLVRWHASQRAQTCSTILRNPKKDQTIRFINDFRELNKRIKRIPYPLPKIQVMLLKLECFKYATSLDLNMGYYHIRLDNFSKSLCTLILPWGKYEMQVLPMGLSNSPDIFQGKMNELLHDLEFVRTYIDDLLIVTNETFQDHLDKLD